MSVWVDGAVPVRRSSRRLSVSASDVESISTAASSTLSSTLLTPAKQTPRKLMLPKSSLIPRLKQIDETMASSDDDVLFVPTPEPGTEKRGRGRPRKNSPARTKMTAIKTPASSVAAVKEAAAAATPAARKEKTPPSRSRSSSRTRKTVSTAAVTPSVSPTKMAALVRATPLLKKIAPVLNFDEESPVVTRRSTRLAATKTPAAATNGHANGSSVQQAVKTTPTVNRFSTEQWREEFTDKHPFFTKMFIPAMICLVYAIVILGVVVYFDIHKKAPQWLDMVARRMNEMYQDFMSRRAAASAAAAADSV